MPARKYFTLEQKQEAVRARDRARYNSPKRLVQRAKFYLKHGARMNEARKVKYAAKRDLDTKKCKTCGGEFRSTQRYRVFCCDECRDAAPPYIRCIIKARANHARWRALNPDRVYAGYVRFITKRGPKLGVCCVCGDAFIKRTNNVTCSIAHAIIHKKRAQRAHNKNQFAERHDAVARVQIFCDMGFADMPTGAISNADFQLEIKAISQVAKEMGL